MAVLHIHLNSDGSLTAIERKYNDEAKYVESFDSWEKLFNSLMPWLDKYAWIEVHTS